MILMGYKITIMGFKAMGYKFTNDQILQRLFSFWFPSFVPRILRLWKSSTGTLDAFVGRGEDSLIYGNVLRNPKIDGTVGTLGI